MELSSYAVKRRLLRPIVYALVAAQLLLSVPVASAWATEGSADVPAAQSMPCDGMEMPGEQRSTDCLCCPDGATSDLDCQTACAAGVAVPTVPNGFLPSPVAVSSAEPLPVIFHPLADPPLIPPPIA